MAVPGPAHRVRWSVVGVTIVASAITGCGGSAATAPSQSPIRSTGPRTIVPGTTRSVIASSTTVVPATIPQPSRHPTPGRALVSGLTARRPTAGVWVVDIDDRLLRFNLMPGGVEPRGQFIRPSSITARFRADVVAAFNGGFKFKDSRGGFWLGGVSAVPLVRGAASLVVFNDGTATVGAWDRDVSMSPDVEAVLQNLRLMVDRGASTDVSDTDAHTWGSTFPKETVARVARSGICVTSDRRMLWIGGPAVGAATLADTMVRSGCRRGMELDINPKWVSFAVFDHPDPTNRNLVEGRNLYDGMHYPPLTYFLGKDRNWLMLTRR